MLTEVDGERSRTTSTRSRCCTRTRARSGSSRSRDATARSARSPIKLGDPEAACPAVPRRDDQGQPERPGAALPARAAPVGTTVQSSIDDLKAALDVEPEFVEALNKRANLLFSAAARARRTRSGRRSSSRRRSPRWTNALDIDPRNAEALTLQANAETALGKGRPAKADALKAIRVDPTSPAANNALARANLALKKPQDAAGPARAALELNPYTNLTYYRTLAEVFKDLKRKTDCSATLNAIVPWLEGDEGQGAQDGGRADPEGSQGELRLGARLWHHPGDHVDQVPIAARLASSSRPRGGLLLVPGVGASRRTRRRPIKPNKNWVFLLSIVTLLGFLAFLGFVVAVLRARGDRAEPEVRDDGRRGRAGDGPIAAPAPAPVTAAVPAAAPAAPAAAAPAPAAPAAAARRAARRLPPPAPAAAPAAAPAEPAASRASIRTTFPTASTPSRADV